MRRCNGLSLLFFSVSFIFRICCMLVGQCDREAYLFRFCNSVFHYICICLSVCLFLFSPLYLCQSVSLSVCQSVSLSVCQAVRLSVFCPSVCKFPISITLPSQTILYNKNYSLIIDIYYYETFSTPTQTFSACTQLFIHPV